LHHLGKSFVPEPTSRRIFLSNGSSKYQVLSFTQERDASYYVSCPNFAASRWIEIVDAAGDKAISVASAPGEGKLSVHGSGFAGIRAHQGSGHSVKVSGSPLVDRDGKTLRVRHLLSVLPEKPHHIPAGVRASDYILTTKELKPLAFIFFAVPNGIRSVELNISMHVDDIGTPPDVSWGFMTFPVHGVLWIAYSTKGMAQWPATTHVAHFDGFTVPMFFGGGPKDWKFAASSPAYALADNVLKITLNAYQETAFSARTAPAAPAKH
jgi:hypothetical protein